MLGYCDGEVPGTGGAVDTEKQRIGGWQPEVLQFFLLEPADVGN